MINNIENLTRMKHLDSKFTRFSKAKSNEVEVGEVDFKPISLNSLCYESNFLKEGNIGSNFVLGSSF